jgi:predicted dinucleotide-binding enzyme
MDIGIIGSGHIGSTLARQLVGLGHQVSIANSRAPESLSDFAAETGAAAVTAAQAAGAQDVVILAVPEKAVPDLPLDVLATSTAVVIDANNYYPARDGQIAEIDAGLTDSEWVAQVIRRPVVKAFNNIVATSLATRRVSAVSQGRICLSVAGDDTEAKQVLLDLLDTLGFDGIDAGTLAESWRQHPGTPAYCRDLDTEALTAALAQADPAKIAQSRDDANEAVRAYFS